MKYEISLDGRNYEVELELAEPMSIRDFQSYAPAAPTAAVVAPAPEAAPSTEAPAFVTSGECITSPMPGNILRVNVAVGDKVSEGQVLVILEAMKMENEIMAPCDGTITQVLTSRGSTVDTDAPLVVIG
ncbi:MAG: biotin/lipoyl-binding protein [Oscillospiraceae bacterium]|nr:biotin/lipoyl-binding protein [Oscillospiraceae bacterium]